MRYLAVFLLGVIIGASMVNLLLSHQQEQLHLTIAELEQELTEANEEVANLKESLDKHSHKVITSIEPVITFNGNKYSEVEKRAATHELKQEIQDILAPLKGQEVDRLNPTLIPAMINGRIIKVNVRQFKLKVTLVLISDKLTVHVEAQELPDSSSSAVSLMEGCPATVAIKPEPIFP
ncbi:MAG: hypothetical protein PWP31_911 [Clostridia bacterium]|nr:hypothetical protein [Clostridia bacterium]